MRKNRKEERPLNYPIEQDDIDNLKFNGDGAGCKKAETDDNFVMTISSPFSDCGTTSTTNDDGDFVFNNAIRFVTRLLLLENRELLKFI